MCKVILPCNSHSMFVIKIWIFYLEMFKWDSHTLNNALQKRKTGRHPLGHYITQYTRHYSKSVGVRFTVLHNKQWETSDDSESAHWAEEHPWILMPPPPYEPSPQLISPKSIFNQEPVRAVAYISSGTSRCYILYISKAAQKNEEAFGFYIMPTCHQCVCA